jgi:hypothetical protein
VAAVSQAHAGPVGGEITLKGRGILLPVLLATLGLGVLVPGPACAEEYLTLETEHFRIYYAPQQEKLAHTATAVAEEAWRRISDFLDSHPVRKIEILIAPDRAAFQQASGGMIPDWGIGLAAPAQARILITSPADAPANIDLEEIITHEVAHVLLGLTLPGQPLPRWFDEGHAMVHARQWRITESTRIVWALLAGTLIPLSDLTYTFPYERASAELAYTESYTAVDFMVRSRGPDAFREFVRDAAHHGDFEAALIEVYGWNLARFDSAWRKSLRTRYPWAVLPAALLSIPGIFTLLFLAAYLRKRWKARRKMAQWQEEDLRYR